VKGGRHVRGRGKGPGGRAVTVVKGYVAGMERLVAYLGSLGR